jgi:hypothetical protein
MGIFLGIITGIIVMALTWRLIFSDWDDFGESIRYTITPDIFSWLSGEIFEDWWASFKLSLWLASGAIPGIAVGYFV